MSLGPFKKTACSVSQLSISKVRPLQDGCIGRSRKSIIDLGIEEQGIANEIQEHMIGIPSTHGLNGSQCVTNMMTDQVDTLKSEASKEEETSTAGTKSILLKISMAE